MDYGIYFHDDFDGHAAAAIMLNFLESRGGSIGKFFPVKYDIRSKWPKLKFEKPTIVVDFYYHPKAVFWFDHHPTTFLREAWKKNFKQSKFKRFDPKYSSCCRLILDTLKKEFNYKPPKHLEELAKWLDIVDGANYKSAKQIMESKESALQIDEFIDNTDARPLTWLIRKLAFEPLKKIAADKRIKKTVELLKKEKRKILDVYRKNLRIKNRVAFINLVRFKNKELRFAPYYLHPKIIYSLNFRKGRSGIFHLSFGANPWRRSLNKINIGALLRKECKGGGHHDIGGAEFTSYKNAENAFNKLVNMAVKRDS